MKNKKYKIKNNTPLFWLALFAQGGLLFGMLYVLYIITYMIDKMFK